MSRTSNATRNIKWGFYNKIVAVIFPFITRTVMIYVMGVQYVGLSSLFSSILQVLSFTELGIGSALVFSMYKPIEEQSVDKICALLNFYKRAYQIIGTIILFVGLTLLPFLKYLVADEVPKGINLQYLFGIYLLNNVIGYYLFAYKQSLFLASQRVDRISAVNMLTQIAMNTLQIIALFFVRSYYTYAIVIPLTTTLNNVIVKILSEKYFPDYKCYGKIDENALREIKKKVKGMVFQKIGGIVLTSVDSIVISAFLGIVLLGIYQNYYYIFVALNGFLSIIMSSIIPIVGNCMITDSIEKNLNDFKKYNFIYIWIVAWCTVCLICLYQPFMKIWVGEERMLGTDMALLFAIYFFIHKWCDMLYVYQEAAGIWWETRFVPIIAAILNLGLNLILVQKIGLQGILISTIIAVVLIYDVGYAIVLFKFYFKSNKALKGYLATQFFYLIIMTLAGLLSFIFCHLIQTDSDVLRLVIYGFICLIVPNIFFLMAWHRLPEFMDSKRLILHIIEQKVRM